MVIYADSSFLTSVYLREAHFESANALLKQERIQMVLTPFIRMELRHALRSMVARKEASSASIAQTFVRIEGDLNQGLLIERTLDAAKLFQAAEHLSSRHGEEKSIRCLDLLHVASAHVLGIKVFLTFDRQQAAFAQLAGLTVKP